MLAPFHAYSHLTPGLLTFRRTSQDPRFVQRRRPEPHERNLGEKRILACVIGAAQDHARSRARQMPYPSNSVLKAGRTGDDPRERCGCRERCLPVYQRSSHHEPPHRGRFRWLSPCVVFIFAAIWTASGDARRDAKCVPQKAATSADRQCLSHQVFRLVRPQAWGSSVGNLYRFKMVFQLWRRTCRFRVRQPDDGSSMHPSVSLIFSGAVAPGMSVVVEVEVWADECGLIDKKRPSKRRQRCSLCRSALLCRRPAPEEWQLEGGQLPCNVTAVDQPQRSAPRPHGCHSSQAAGKTGGGDAQGERRGWRQDCDLQDPG